MLKHDLFRSRFSPRINPEQAFRDQALARRNPLLERDAVCLDDLRPSLDFCRDERAEIIGRRALGLDQIRADLLEPRAQITGLARHNGKQVDKFVPRGASRSIRSERSSVASCVGWASVTAVVLAGEQRPWMPRPAKRDHPPGEKICTDVRRCPHARPGDKSGAAELAVSPCAAWRFCSFRGRSIPPSFPRATVFSTQSLRTFIFGAFWNKRRTRRPCRTRAVAATPAR